MSERVPLSKTEEQLLDYIRTNTESGRTVWLSEAIEALGLNPPEAVHGAKRLETLGLLKPKPSE